MFGEGIRIYDRNHKFADFTRLIKKQGYSLGNVKIGKHCWIGSNVIILKGADIGDNCVIGAGCVVTEQIKVDSLVKLSKPVLIDMINNI